MLVTLGKAGSQWRYKGEQNNVDTITVSPVDTTGAGDAFFAGALSVLSQKVSNGFTKQVLDYALKFGNIAGALNTTGRGAIDNLPTLDTINKYLV